MKIAVMWFRRDLRVEDNRAFQEAVGSGYPVLPVFIFDPEILDELPGDDARITFIHAQLEKIDRWMRARGSALRVDHGDPLSVWKSILAAHSVAAVYLNKDYEPYAIERDRKVESLLAAQGTILHRFKDQVIYEEDEILKPDGTPYTVFTPFRKRWLEKYATLHVPAGLPAVKGEFVPGEHPFPSLEQLGFRKSDISVRPWDLSGLKSYPNTRDYPAEDGTSHLSPHLRFGTVSIRQIISRLGSSDIIFLSELIWREFFMQILFHFPMVVHSNFHTKYNGIRWRNNEDEFNRWCRGETGFPLVDAGMRQLNETGIMHNRVRMVTASFLCKHLLVDWCWGEAYFAGKLLDYELSSNNGNWQWAAGTGCDAAPYFRIFNPHEQLKKFDPDHTYVRRWVPELGKSAYQPMVDHKKARIRALETYKQGLFS